MFEKIFNSAAKDAQQTVAAISQASPLSDEFTIETRGEKKVVTFSEFPALVGYALAEEFENNFLLAKDHETRLAFIKEVVSYAHVGSVRLDNDSAINQTCDDWQTLEAIFRGTLAFNKIDCERIEETKMKMWEEYGDRFGLSMFRAMNNLLDPMFEAVGRKQHED